MKYETNSSSVYNHTLAMIMVEYASAVSSLHTSNRARETTFCLVSLRKAVVELRDATLVGEGNETFLIRVWKPLPRRVSKRTISASGGLGPLHEYFGAEKYTLPVKLS